MGKSIEKLDLIKAEVQPLIQAASNVTRVLLEQVKNASEKDNTEALEKACVEQEKINNHLLEIQEKLLQEIDQEDEVDDLDDLIASAARDDMRKNMKKSILAVSLAEANNSLRMFNEKISANKQEQSEKNN